MDSNSGVGNMKENVKKQSLGGGISIFTDKDHVFGTDAILLADFADAETSKKAVDLGTGCGIIPLLWCRREKPAHIDGVDIQPSATYLSGLGVAENSLQNRLTIHEGDLCEIENILQIGSYDLVTCNPPYKAINDGVISPNERRAIARHEIKCNLEDVVKAASLLLNTGGRFCMCHRPSRLCDAMYLMRKHNIEPKRLCFVHQRDNTEPNLFLIEGKKASSPFLTVMPPIYIEDENGNFSDRIKEIMGEYYLQTRGE